MGSTIVATAPGMIVQPTRLPQTRRTMRVIQTCVTAIALAVALPLVAADGVKPPLVPDFKVNSNDSELVRAAKTAVANRMGSTAKVIDATALANTHGVLSYGSSSYQPPSSSSGSIYPGNAANTASPQTYAPTVDRAATQKKIDQLNHEQGRMAFEAEQPYGGDVSEDRVTQRMTQIPQEQKTLQQQLNQPAAPPPAPPPNQQ